MGNNYNDSRGTSKSSYKVGKVDIDASAATTSRSITVGDNNIDFSTASVGQFLQKTGANSIGFASVSSGLNIFTGPTTMGGTYTGDCFVDPSGGAVTLNADTTINGNLYIGAGTLGTGNNGTRGYNLTVSGDIYLSKFGQLNLKDNTARTGAQNGLHGGTLTCGGDLISDGDTEYSSPDIVVSGGNSGPSGGQAGNSGYVFIFGDCLNVRYILAAGGATAQNFVQGGAGGYIFIGGNAHIYQVILADGSGSGAPEGIGGNGGTVIIGGNLKISQLVSVSGGDYIGSSGSTNGGSGGTITIYGDVSSYKSSSFPPPEPGLNANGGGFTYGSTVGGYGGSGGTITVYGNIMQGNLIAVGGEGSNFLGMGGNGGTITVKGNISKSSLTVYGGSGASNGGLGGTVTLGGNVNNTGINIKGGNCSSSGPSGFAGLLDVSGNAHQVYVEGTGGNGQIDGIGGNGGTVVFRGNYYHDGYGIDVSGGDAVYADGGSGGNITIFGTGHGSFTSRGGNSTGSSGNGGHGGSVYVNSLVCGSYGISGGITTFGGNCVSNSGTPGNSGNVEVQTAQNCTINMRGGRNTTLSTGGSTGTLRIYATNYNVVIDVINYFNGVMGNVYLGSGWITKLSMQDENVAGLRTVSVAGDLNILEYDQLNSVATVEFDSVIGGLFSIALISGLGTPPKLSSSTAAINVLDKYVRSAGNWGKITTTIVP